ncbi:Alpha/beta hydrolase fold, partial [Trema orientale]
WRRQVQFFAPKFDVYVPDLVFFGGSTTRSGDRTEAFQAAAVAGLMETIGVGRYSLVGTSYGGIVAYNIARRWPERVEKVVIASSGVNMRRRDGEALLKRANLERTEDLLLPATARQLRTLLGLAVFKRPNILPEFFLNDLLNKLYSEKRKEKMELLKGLTIGRDDEAKVSPLDKDVLLVWGDHDQIFPFEMATELKELLGKKVKLEVMKNTSHVPQTEKPALFNEIVNNFLCQST